MALYVITSMIRRKDGKDWKISQYGEVVVTSHPNSEAFAQGIFQENFAKGTFAKDGWSLVGNPLIFEHRQDDIMKWWDSITPGSVQRAAPHLRLVEE